MINGVNNDCTHMHLHPNARTSNLNNLNNNKNVSILAQGA